MNINEIMDNPEKQIEVFSNIIKKMNSSTDYEESLITLISEIKAVMNSNTILLYLVDQELNNLNFEMSIGPLGDKCFGSIIDNDKPIAVRAYTTSASLYSNDPKEDSNFVPLKDMIGNELKNILFVPVKIRKRNIAAIFLLNKKNGNFVEKDTVLMKSFAHLVSLSLVNKINYEKAQSRAYEVAALYEMSISINRCETF